MSGGRQAPWRPGSRGGPGGLGGAARPSALATGEQGVVTRIPSPKHVVVVELQSVRGMIEGTAVYRACLAVQGDQC
jgi:hypothetical protein